MQHSLRAAISLRFALLVLVVISLISIVSNILISRQFESYVEEHQKIEADSIAQNLSSQYRADAGGWNIDYVHGMGMSSLNEGFIIKLYDKDETILWDAENHDMSLCHELMESINLRMQDNRPDMEDISFIETT